MTLGVSKACLDHGDEWKQNPKNVKIMDVYVGASKKDHGSILSFACTDASWF